MCIYIYALEVQADYFLNGFSVKTIVLVGIYNQQFKGTILFMVFDFQGVYIYAHPHYRFGTFMFLFIFLHPRNAVSPS